jgi:hypothetical protein
MSENGFTPDTEYVRAVYEDALDFECEAEFDRWLAKHDQETFDDGFAHGAEYGHVSQGMWPTH